MTIQAINPATGEALATYEEMTPEEVERIVGEVHEDFLSWRSTGFAERARLMRKAAEVLRGNAGDYARLMAREMGKPVRDGVAEAQKCALACDYFAENAERFLAREPVQTEARNQFRHLSAARRRVGGHAVELSLLAGLPFRCARPDGG